nr:hypothetical protein [Solirubrobacter soli]
MKLSRRNLLGWAGVSAAAGFGAAVGIDAASRSDDDVSAAAIGDQTVRFHGEHQAGIATPVQDRLRFAAFDLIEGATRRDLTDLLRGWSAAAVRDVRRRPGRRRRGKRDRPGAAV